MFYKGENMFKFEQRILDCFRKHYVVLFFCFATLIGILAHTSGINSISADMRCYLIPWWNEIISQGPEVMGRQVGNYNIPYQIIIFILSRINTDPVFSSAE